MKREDISEAVSNISTNYIEEAVYNKNKSSRYRWIKLGILAACLCLAILAGVFAINPLTSDIVGEPGLFTVTAYALTPSKEVSLMEEYKMSEGVKLSAEYSWSMAMSSMPGLPLKLSIEEYKDAKFDISTDGGQCVLWDKDIVTSLEPTFTIDNDKTIYWSSLISGSKDKGVQKYEKNKAYIDITVRDDNDIIGYAVVKVYTSDKENTPVESYHAMLLKSVSYPKVDGKYQNITDDYIKSQIQQVKESDTE